MNAFPAPGTWTDCFTSTTFHDTWHLSFRLHFRSQWVLMSRSLSASQCSSDGAPSKRALVCSPRDYNPGRPTGRPLSDRNYEPLASPPKCDNEDLLLNTFKLLQDLAGKIEKEHHSAEYDGQRILQKQRATGRNCAPAANGSKLPDHMWDAAAIRPEDKELQKAMKRLHRERKKLIEKQK